MPTLAELMRLFSGEKEGDNEKLNKYLDAYFSGQSVDLTPEDLTTFGYTLDEGYSLSFVPDEVGNGFKESLLTPEGWKLSDFADNRANKYTSPEGVNFTYDELFNVDQTTQIMSDGIDGAADFETEQAAQAATFQQLWDSVFPEINLNDLVAAFDAKNAPAAPQRGELTTDTELDTAVANQQIDAFYEALMAAGRNENTEAILRELGATDEEIDEIFAGSTGIPGSQLDNTAGLTQVQPGAATNPLANVNLPQDTTFTIQGENGQAETLTLKKDGSIVNAAGVKVATYDKATGTIKPVDQSFWKKAVNFTLKAFETVNKPIAATGRAFFETGADPMAQTYDVEVNKASEKEINEFLASKGVPYGAVPDEYKDEVVAIQKKYEDAFNEKYPDAFSTENVQKRYENQEWWQQLLYELPGFVGAGVAVAPVEGVLASIAAAGGWAGRLAKLGGTVVDLTYGLGIGQTGSFSFNFSREAAENINKDIVKIIKAPIPLTITDEMTATLKTLGYTGEEILTMKPAEAVKALSKAQDALQAGLKTGADTVTGALDKAAGKVDPSTAVKTANVATDAIKATPTTPVKTAEGFADNIRLEKFADEVKPDIEAFVKSHGDVVDAVTRGTVKFADTEKYAEELILRTGGDPTKLIKKVGQAYNDAEIRAIGGMLASTTDEMNALRKVLDTPAGNTVENTLKLAQLLEKHNYFQLAAHASRAEAGRALSSLRMIQDAIKSNSNPVMEKVLRQLKGKAEYDKILLAMKGLDWNNPAQINDFIRNVNKPGAGDYLYEWWVNSILSGPLTHARNAISNSINAVMSPVERATSAVIEGGLSKLQGRQAERFIDEVPTDIFGAMQGIPEGIRGALTTIKTGLSPTAISKYEFRPSAFKGKLGRVVNTPVTLLEAADNLGFNMNFRAALNSEIIREGRKQGLKGKALLDFVAQTKISPPADMITKASDIANYRLFRAEGSKIAEALYKIREIGFDMPGLGHVEPLKYFIPFVRTPVNIAKYGLERSPLGFFSPALWRNISKKSPEAADQLARAFIGSVMTGGIAMLFAEGRITGAAPISAGARDRFYREGKQPYSIKIGDKWYSYQRLEPFNTDFTLVAIAVEAITNKDAAADERAWDAVSSLLKNFVSQTYMSGLSDIVDAITQPETSGNNFIRNLAQGFVPFSGAARTAAYAFDPTYRKPTNFVESIEAGIPFLSWRVPPKLNAFGEPITRTTPWFSPINISEEQDTTINQELAKHGINIGFVGGSINGVKLTPEQEQQYQTLAGGMAKEAILKLINSDAYKNMTLDDQKTAIQSAANKAKADARLQMIQDGSIPSSQTDIDQLNNLPGKFGTVTNNTSPLSIEDPEIYDTADYFREAKALLKNIKISDVTNPLALAVNTAVQTQATLDGLRNSALTGINADPTKGDTYEQYYAQWQARQRITDPDELKAFDEQYPNAYKGNITPRELDLLRQYHALKTKQDKAQFLEDHPELTINPREQYLIDNPEENARLAIFGQAKILTKEAYDAAQEMLKTLGIPDSAAADYLPPKDIAEDYFKYNELVGKWGANSAEVKLLLYDNPALTEYLGRQPITDNVAVLSINAQFRTQDAEYDALTTKEERTAYLAANEDYKNARYARTGLEMGFTVDNIDQWVEYNNLPDKGYWKERYRLEHPEFDTQVKGFQKTNNQSIWADIDPGKVPTKEYDEITEQYADLFDQYDNVQGTNAERDAARQAIFDANPEFKRAYYTRNAYKMELNEINPGYVSLYASYNLMTTKGYAQERFLKENPQYYLDVWLGVLGNQPIDFKKIPTKEVELLLDVYDNLPTGKQREAYRKQHPDLDKYLVEVVGLKPLGGTTKRRTTQSEFIERFIRNEQIAGLR